MNNDYDPWKYESHTSWGKDSWTAFNDDINEGFKHLDITSNTSTRSDNASTENTRTKSYSNSQMDELGTRYVVQDSEYKRQLEEEKRQREEEYFQRVNPRYFIDRDEYQPEWQLILNMLNGRNVSTFAAQETFERKRALAGLLLRRGVIKDAQVLGFDNKNLAQEYAVFLDREQRVRQRAVEIEQAELEAQKIAFANYVDTQSIKNLSERYNWAEQLRTYYKNDYMNTLRTTIPMHKDASSLLWWFNFLVLAPMLGWFFIFLGHACWISM